MRACPEVPLRPRPQVWSAEEQDWKCKIDAGVEGVTHMRWSPDSRHVLTHADFNTRVTAWSLVDKSSTPIPMPCVLPPSRVRVRQRCGLWLAGRTDPSIRVWLVFTRAQEAPEDWAGLQR